MLDNLTSSELQEERYEKIYYDLKKNVSRIYPRYNSHNLSVLETPEFNNAENRVNEMVDIMSKAYYSKTEYKQYTKDTDMISDFYNSTDLNIIWWFLYWCHTKNESALIKTLNRHYDLRQTHVLKSCLQSNLINNKLEFTFTKNVTALHCLVCNTNWYPDYDMEQAECSICKNPADNFTRLNGKIIHLTHTRYKKRWWTRKPKLIKDVYEVGWEIDSTTQNNFNKSNGNTIYG